MIARNRYQKQVEAANNALPPYRGGAIQWAADYCSKKYAFRMPSGRATCMECGHVFRTGCDCEEVTCPHCGRRLHVKATTARLGAYSFYFSVLTSFRGLQVLRCFIMNVMLHKGHRAVYKATEIVRYWINDKGEVQVCAKKRKMGMYADALCMESPIELRKDNQAYRYIADSCNVYPRYNTIPVLRRNGLVGKLPDIYRLVSFLTALLTDPRIETMYKAGRVNDISYFLANGTSNLDRFWPSYKITLRNNYEISEIDIWCDYVSLLRKLGKDILNAFYVCPKDLRGAHDKAMERKQKIEQGKERQNAMRIAIGNEAEFRKAKGKFFGLHFTDGLITVDVLDSVAAYYEEGFAMHHCVGEMQYYKKPDSIVLSAKIDGKRVETVEVSLKSFRVLQSRGAYNKNTQWHERIISLVNKNANKIAHFCHFPKRKAYLCIKESL